MHDWREYQVLVAQLFRSLGLQASVEAVVQGARGIHAIDVLVEGQLGGLPVRWVVECKAWRTRVTKEKALALLAVVQDLGADKGVLVSEVGFQRGAIAMARNANLILLSLAELESLSQKSLFEAGVTDLYHRLVNVKASLDSLVRGNLHAKFSRIERALRLRVTLNTIDEPLHDIVGGSRKSVTLHFTDWENDRRWHITSTLEEFVQFAAVNVAEAEEVLAGYAELTRE